MRGPLKYPLRYEEPPEGITNMHYWCALRVSLQVSLKHPIKLNINYNMFDILQVALEGSLQTALKLNNDVLGFAPLRYPRQ